MTEETGQGSEPPVAESTSLLTFLIADLRGYTRYTHENGDAAAARLADRFAALCSEIMGRHEGRVIELRGDEALAVFISARNALRGAVALQQTFKAAMRDDPSLPLTVGIGLDAGEPITVRGGYRGAALNLAARLCSLAGRGEIFASQGLVQIARRIEGFTYVDRGQMQLKGFPDPVRIIQVAQDGTLPRELQPLQQILVAHPNNLPLEPTPFIGRSSELGEILNLIHRPSVRLLTLTGAGGTGKTRLALQVGAALLDEFPDGVFFVSLATVSEPELVLPTIVQSLEIPEQTGASPDEVLRNALREKKLLLVLDNFEQVRTAAPDLTTLLAACPGLRILVTSRAVLNEYGEYSFDVPPLSVPDPRHLPALGAISQYESVELFIERARAIRAGFEVTAENAPAIAEICHRLDGLPLAIELAAARVRILPPQAIMTRLESRLSFLTGRMRGRPERQSTLRSTIEWSYDLLTPDERRLFARLAVFVGGCTLDAAEVVGTAGNALDIDPLDGIGALVENSLMRQVGDDEPRFIMLETIREYALSGLESEPDAGDIRAAHASYYLEFAERSDAALRGPEQGEWLRRLDAEHDNLRAALAWFLEDGDGELGLRLAGALWRFWWSRGYLSEGRVWLERMLARGSGSPDARATALNGLANIAWSQGKLDEAEGLYREALALRRQVGSEVGIAGSLNNLGLVTEQRGDFVGAATWYRQALEAARAVGDTWTTALVLGNLGGVLTVEGQTEEATTALEESLLLWRGIGDRASEGRVLNNLMNMALEEGTYGRAAALQRESLSLYRDLGHLENVAICLEGAARILTAVEKFGDAVALWGSAEALRQALGQPIPPVNGEERETFLEKARSWLGPHDFDLAWTEGMTLTPAGAGERALHALGQISS